MFIFGSSQAETAMTQSSSDGSAVLSQNRTWIEARLIQNLRSAQGAPPHAQDKSGQSQGPFRPRPKNIPIPTT